MTKKKFILWNLLYVLSVTQCAFIHDEYKYQKLSDITFDYNHELNNGYHLNAAVEFVKQQKAKAKKLNKNIAKNVIMFVGNGMSLPITSASRIYVGGEKSSLSFEEFPYVSMTKTYCVDKQVADSACAATGKIRDFQRIQIYHSLKMRQYVILSTLNRCQIEFGNNWSQRQS